MSHLRCILHRHITTDGADVRLGQLACLAAGPASMVAARRGTVRFASTPGEVFLGVLAGPALALLLVLMGLVLPLAQGKSEA